MKLFNYLSIILLFVVFYGHSQIKNVGQPFLHNFQKTDYNGGTQTWAMAQAENGTIYMANNAGLLEYDGSFWHTYTVGQNRSIRSLLIVKDRIYIGGYNEFGYFEKGASGVFRYTSLSDKLTPDERNQIDNIWKIHALKDRVIYQSFDRHYIYKDEKLTISDALGKYQFSFPLESDRLLVQDIENGLFIYDKGSEKWLSGTEMFVGTEIWSALKLQPDELLLATLDKGLFRYNNKGIASWNNPANDFLKKNSCLGAAFIDKDHIVFNSVLDGVIIADLNGNIVQHINRQNGLQNNTVLCSLVDRDKNLWLGLDNGISLVIESNPLTFFGSDFNLSTVYATAFYGNKLFVATNQGLFVRELGAARNNGPFRLVKGSTGQAWNVEVINQMLLCSHNRGLMRIEGESVAEIIDPVGYWGIKPLKEHPGLFLGANYNGFTILSKTDNSLKLRNRLQGIAKSTNTFETDGHTVWMKKDNALFKCTLTPELDKFRTIRKIDHIFPGDKGIASLQKIKGEITFQSANRIFSFNDLEQSFTEIRKLSALFQKNPPVKMINEDQFGNLWFAYNEKLGLYKRDGDGYVKVSTAFSGLNGMLVNDYISINARNQDEILIGMTNGLAHFNPSLQKARPIPSAIIRSFAHAGDSLSVSRLSEKKDHYVPFRNNNVRFSFSSPQFEQPGAIEFSYRLKGFDDDWSRWSNASTKEYTNLHEGDYKMELRTRNAFGQISPATAFSFTVSPPWYRHWLAWCIYVLVAAGAIFVIRERIRQHIRRNKYFETVEQRRIYLEKEAKIRQDQLQLEKQIELLKNEKLRLQILAKDKELVNNSLQVVKKNKILNGIIHKMKEIDSERLDETSRSQISRVNKGILKEVNADKSWKDLEKHIRNVHFDFLKRLKEKHPAITPRELDLSTYLLMNMSTKEIAEIMNISSGGVELARYRLRKKLGLAKNENLTGFLMSV